MARQIDILYLVHISTDSLYKMLAYRIGGGKGKIYLKTDLGIYAKNGKDLLKWKNMSIPLKIFHYIFKPLPDVYTVEIKQSYERLSNSYYGDLVDKGKLFLLPNGFDPEILQECGITRRAVFEKEKIMITVGRIGSNQKNTELLLDVLSRVDLKDWVFYLIGPIEESFKKNIEDFYAENPDKKRNVVFTGLISQKELYEYYNRSRITVLTSRHESFAFVLVEAVYMKNYVVSTDVGWAKDMLDYVDAAIVPCEDDQIVHKFVSKLQEIVDYSDDKLNSLVSEKDIDEITWEWILKNNDAIKMLL